MAEAGESEDAGLRRRLWIVAIGAIGGVAMLLGFLFVPNSIRPAPPQPVQFGHEAHVKLMACDFCHRLYETSEMAGRPELFRCMLCHAYPVTDKPEAQHLRALAEQGRPLPWVRLTRLLPFVRFSHQRHVVVGQVDCQSCHGDIAQAAAPPRAPLVSITMQFCLDCHRAKAQQLAPGAVKTLQADALDAELLEAVQALARKRFQSPAELRAALTRSAGQAPMDADAQRIAGLLRPANPVTTDCFACHR
jgi:predicted CXXCH cytochrome family protein